MQKDHSKRITAWALQVVPGLDKKKASADSASLVEVGPRVCLNPIKIFGGSFGGPVLFDNPHFVSPNRVSYAAAAMLFYMHVRHFDHDAAQRPHGLSRVLPLAQETTIHCCICSLLPMYWSVLCYSLNLPEVCLCGNADTHIAEEERSQQVWSQGVS